MSGVRRIRTDSAVLVITLLGLGTAASAQDTPAPSGGVVAPAPAAPQLDARTALHDARRLVVDGRNDEAIEILTVLLEQLKHPPGDLETLEETYLLLVKTYVTGSTLHALRAEGAVTSRLYFDRAQALTEECILTSGLHHVVPDPADFPEKGVRMFERMRHANLGAFRISKLDPPEAMVLLDAKTIKPPGDGPPPEVNDIVAGSHRLVIRAEGYKELSELVQVPAGETVAPGYRLERHKGLGWWALRSGGAVALVGLGAVLWPEADPPPASEPPDPLPDAPDPPGP